MNGYSGEAAELTPNSEKKRGWPFTTPFRLNLGIYPKALEGSGKQSEPLERTKSVSSSMRKVELWLHLSKTAMLDLPVPEWSSYATKY